MRVFFALLSLLLFATLPSCSTSECERKLENDYPEIPTYIKNQELAKHSEVTCTVKEHNSYTFYGYQEPEGKCHFFDVELTLENVLITTFSFLIDDKRQYDILVYEFESDEDLEKFKKFIPDASLYYEKNKEIHDFFEAKDKVYLYFHGIP
ncbi:hypothetical protein [Parvicella tangerina]|uniref:DUF4825 domain-containing protein n=1 Tax=Parvicella tangerina TaxID=2829795 RepID=A0A916JPW2_9FLAO|nr:hypothetical protein [Parvicella tangerina]CAG5085652.1 hypothetical protein CRYO30217_02827 [Parvicella tangerina]